MLLTINVQKSQYPSPIIYYIEASSCLKMPNANRKQWAIDVSYSALLLDIPHFPLEQIQNPSTKQLMTDKKTPTASFSFPRASTPTVALGGLLNNIPTSIYTVRAASPSVPETRRPQVPLITNTPNNSINSYLVRAPNKPQSQSAQSISNQMPRDNKINALSQILSKIYWDKQAKWFSTIKEASRKRNFQRKQLPKILGLITKLKLKEFEQFAWARLARTDYSFIKKDCSWHLIRATKFSNAIVAATSRWLSRFQNSLLTQSMRSLHKNSQKISRSIQLFTTLSKIVSKKLKLKMCLALAYMNSCPKRRPASKQQKSAIACLSQIIAKNKAFSFARLKIQSARPEQPVSKPELQYNEKQENQETEIVEYGSIEELQQMAQNARIQTENQKREQQKQLLQLQQTIQLITEAIGKAESQLKPGQGPVNEPHYVGNQTLSKSPTDDLFQRLKNLYHQIGRIKSTQLIRKFEFVHRQQIDLSVLDDTPECLIEYNQCLKECVSVHEAVLCGEDPSCYMRKPEAEASSAEEEEGYIKQVRQENRELKKSISKYVKECYADHRVLEEAAKCYRGLEEAAREAAVS